MRAVQVERVRHEQVAATRCQPTQQQHLRLPLHQLGISQALVVAMEARVAYGALIWPVNLHRSQARRVHKCEELAHRRLPCRTCEASIPCMTSAGRNALCLGPACPCRGQQDVSPKLKAERGRACGSLRHSVAIALVLALQILMCAKTE